MRTPFSDSSGTFLFVILGVFFVVYINKMSGSLHVVVLGAFFEVYIKKIPGSLHFVFRMLADPLAKIFIQEFTFLAIFCRCLNSSGSFLFVLQGIFIVIFITKMSGSLRLFVRMRAEPLAEASICPFRYK